MIKKTLLGLVLVVVVGCNNKSKDTSPFDPHVVRSVECNAEIVLPESIKNPLEMVFRNDRILMLDETEFQIVKIISTDGLLLGGYGIAGNGPNEFNQITSLDFDYKVGVYDQGFKKYVEIDTGGSINKLWENDLELDVVHRLGDSVYIGSALYDSVSLYLLDKKGGILGKCAYFPPNTRNHPLLSHSMACSGYIATHSGGKYFAKSVTWDGGIDFFEVDNAQIKHLWRHSNFDMDYDVVAEQHNIPTPNPHTKVGYVAINVTDKYIFALYASNRLLDNYATRSNEIHVFDYSGVHVAKLILDRKISTFTVDQLHKIIYSITENKDGSLSLVAFQIEV